MILTLAVLMSLIFVVWLIVALVKQEAGGSDFWWKLLIAVAVVTAYGVFKV